MIAKVIRSILNKFAVLWSINRIAGYTRTLSRHIVCLERSIKLSLRCRCKLDEGNDYLGYYW